jgi:hypothetical protein
VQLAPGELETKMLLLHLIGGRVRGDLNDSVFTSVKTAEPIEILEAV